MSDAPAPAPAPAPVPVLAAAPVPARPATAARRPAPGGVAAGLGLLYAAAGYVSFLLVLGYAIGFFAGRGVPKGID